MRQRVAGEGVAVGFGDAGERSVLGVGDLNAEVAAGSAAGVDSQAVTGGNQWLSDDQAFAFRPASSDTKPSRRMRASPGRSRRCSCR